MSDHGAGGGHAESPLKKAGKAVLAVVGVGAAIVVILWVIGFYIEPARANLHTINVGHRGLNRELVSFDLNVKDTIFTVVQILLPLGIFILVLRWGAKKLQGGDDHGGGHH